MRNVNINTDSLGSDASATVTLLTTQEAGRYLGLATSTLNKWRCHGDGPVFIKLGRAVRYRKEDLGDFLAKCAKHSTSQA